MGTILLFVVFILLIIGLIIGKAWALAFYLGVWVFFLLPPIIVNIIERRKKKKERD